LAKTELLPNYLCFIAGINSPANKSAKKGRKTRDPVQATKEAQVQMIPNTYSGEASTITITTTCSEEVTQETQDHLIPTHM
jgi:hypothetical protein